METGHGTQYSVNEDAQVSWTSFLFLGMDDFALCSRFDYVLENDTQTADRSNEVQRLHEGLRDGM